jgi:hypothetical protein
MSEHPFDGLYTAVEETQFAPGIVVGEVLAQITFGAGGGNPLDDFRTLGIDELAHFGDERGLAVCGEQDWSNECHLMDLRNGRRYRRSLVCHGLRFAAFGRLPNVTALEGDLEAPRTKRAKA